MTDEQIIRELNIVIDKNKGKILGVGETRTDYMARDCLDVIQRQQAQITELTALVEAYRLAGEWAEFGTSCHDCPVRLGACGKDKKPACQHPAEYEAEWLKAREGK